MAGAGGLEDYPEGDDAGMDDDEDGVHGGGAIGIEHGDDEECEEVAQLEEGENNQNSIITGGAARGLRSGPHQ